MFFYFCLARRASFCKKFCIYQVSVIVRPNPFLNLNSNCKKIPLSFPPLTCHFAPLPPPLVSNIYAVKCVTMESLNPGRFQTLWNRFWADYRHSSDPTNLTMKCIKQRENLFFWKLRKLPRVSIGVPINECHQPIGMFALQF